MRDYYQEIKDILGPDCAIVPVGDVTKENTGNTEVTTDGNGSGDGLTFTYSGDRKLFTPVTEYIRNQIRLPSVGFDGILNELDTPDDAHWSHVLDPFSVGAWINMVDATGSTIMGKFRGSSSNREWYFAISASDLLSLVFVDEDSAGNDAIITRSDVAITEGIWVFVVGTSDGSANASGLNLYEQGALVASTDDDQAGFVSMRDNTNVMEVGSREIGSSLFDGRMRGGAIGPFHTRKELSVVDILNLHDIGLAAQRSQRSRSLAGVL